MIATSEQSSAVRFEINRKQVIGQQRVRANRRKSGEAIQRVSPRNRWVHCSSPPIKDEPNVPLPELRTTVRRISEAPPVAVVAAVNIVIRSSVDCRLSCSDSLAATGAAAAATVGSAVAKNEAHGNEGAAVEENDDAAEDPADCVTAAAVAETSAAAACTAFIVVDTSQSLPVVSGSSIDSVYGGGGSSGAMEAAASVVCLFGDGFVCRALLMRREVDRSATGNLRPLPLPSRRLQQKRKQGG